MIFKRPAAFLLPAIHRPASVAALARALWLFTGLASAQGDADFLAAKEAFERGDRARLDALAAGLKTHLLAPYVAYWQIKLRLDDVDYDTVRAFLTQYSSTPLAERLTIDWLKTAAKRGDWAYFALDYPPSAGEDAELRCYGIELHRQRDGDADTDWFNSESLVSATAMQRCRPRSRCGSPDNPRPTPANRCSRRSLRAASCRAPIDARVFAWRRRRATRGSLRRSRATPTRMTGCRWQNLRTSNETRRARWPKARSDGRPRTDRISRCMRSSAWREKTPTWRMRCGSNGASAFPRRCATTQTRGSPIMRRANCFRARTIGIAKSAMRRFPASSKRGAFGRRSVRLHGAMCARRSTRCPTSSNRERDGAIGKRARCASLARRTRPARCTRPSPKAFTSMRFSPQKRWAAASSKSRSSKASRRRPPTKRARRSPRSPACSARSSSPRSTCAPNRAANGLRSSTARTTRAYCSPRITRAAPGSTIARSIPPSGRSRATTTRSVT